MDRTSNNEWNDEMDIRNFGDLLQQMNSQYSANQEASHYHSAFVPATNPPWTSQQPHPHMLQMDPTLNNSPLGAQVGMNPLRSFSVTQPPYPEMDCSHTPLMRSSSDLGVRLNHFPTSGENFSECQLQGIDPHIETLDSSVFYPPNPHFHSGSPYQQITVSNNEKIIMNQNPAIHYGSYITEQPECNQQNEQSSNLSTKLSNFTASLSLGTWLSPLDQIRTNYRQGMQIPDNSGTACGNQENSNNNIQTSSIMCSKTVETSSNFPKEMKPQINPKPRYSDVLSKAPTQEGKSFGNSKANNQQNNSSYKFREPTSKCSNNRGNKHRNNNIGFGRSSSPNLTFHNSSNNATDIINAKNLKFDSKVGLDEFDLPVSISQCNSTSVNSTVSNNSNTSENERTKKRTTSNNNEPSPSHQNKKGSKYDKTSGEKIQNEGESTHCDKLNNHALSTQQKQTPKRTTYINNNFTSFSVNASKNSNSESNSNSSNGSSISINSSSNTFQNRKNISPAKEDDAKVHGESVSNVANNKYACNVQNSPSSSSVPLSSSGNGLSSSNRSGGGNNFRSGRYTNRAERNRENQTKRSNAYSKKKKEATPYTHSELLMTGWTMCLLWAGKAGLWLWSLITDVAQMSYRLLVHFSLQIFEKGKICYTETKHALKYQWTKTVDYLFRKKADGKKGGRNDRKFPFGLENNIPLPTTGEEAMKRLLACRGKDPYSILGVTRDCTDDDIKKYYKRQAFLVHPDKNKQPGAEEAFKILAHAFEIIGEPERREAYNNKLAEEAHLEGASSELASLLNLLKEKLEEAANTIRCTNCNKRHRRTKLPRPVYAARHCAECQIRHAAREGDIWAESWHIGLWWKYYACMEGAIYDISDWASCQRDNLKHLQANTHSVQYRIVSGKKNSGGKTSTPECPTDPELEEFFNNLCRERFGQDFVPGNSSQSGASSQADVRRRRGKKKK